MGANTDRRTFSTTLYGRRGSKSPSLPIISILGPPGSGKGTICKQLAADFDLHHLSVGDWLRARAAPPIAGVPDRINANVFEGVAVPETVMEAEYGKDKEADAPAPLTLYNCSKRITSTPESMECRLMPALKTEIESLSAMAYAKGWRSWRDRRKAVLLDNLMSTITHAEAAGEIFGGKFPMMAIAVHCEDETAEARFLRRGRGSDDATRFKRRIAGYREGISDVMAFLRERGTGVVEVSTEGESETLYCRLREALAGNEQWKAMIAERDQEESNVDMQKLLQDMRSEVGVHSHRHWNLVSQGKKQNKRL